jgi:hypothetical protein
MPKYLLKDIGIRCDQVGAIVSGNLRRDPLALSPSGSQSSPAFQGISAPVAENSNFEQNEDPDCRLILLPPRPSPATQTHNGGPLGDRRFFHA